MASCIKPLEADGSEASALSVFANDLLPASANGAEGARRGESILIASPAELVPRDAELRPLAATDAAGVGRTILVPNPHSQPASAGSGCPLQHGHQACACSVRCQAGPPDSVEEQLPSLRPLPSEILRLCLLSI